LSLRISQLADVRFTYISLAVRLFLPWILRSWQGLTTNFWYLVTQFAELLSDCWNIGTNRCRGTRFLSHKQFSHKQIRARADIQPDLLIFNKYRSTGKSELSVFLAGAIQVRTMMGCFGQRTKNCLD